MGDLDLARARVVELTAQNDGLRTDLTTSVENTQRVKDQVEQLTRQNQKLMHEAETEREASVSLQHTCFVWLQTDTCSVF